MDVVLILGNGVWTDDADARRRSLEAHFVIAADGGYSKALAAGARVDLVVGDLDSLGDSARSSLMSSQIPIRRYPAAKDWSDLELALDEAMARRPEKVVILGALGARLDHALTNIHLLERGLEERIFIELRDGRQVVALTDGRHEVDEASVGDCVSLIPISETVRVTTSGLAYSLCDSVLARTSSRGVSNVVAEIPVVVTVQNGKLLVIHEQVETR